MQIAPQNREQQMMFTSIDDYISPENTVRIIEAIINPKIFIRNEKMFQVVMLSNVILSGVEGEVEASLAVRDSSSLHSSE